MSSLEEIFMPEDSGQTVEIASEQPTSIGEEISFDDLFEDKADEPNQPTDVTSDEENSTGAQESSDSLGDDGAEQAETVEAALSITDDATQPEEPENELSPESPPFQVDPATKCLWRVLALSKEIRDMRARLKAYQNEAKETKKAIDEASERMLILTEELGHQIDFEPDDLDSFADDDVVSTQVENETSTESQDAPEPEQPEDAKPEVTPPGPKTDNRKILTVVTTKDIRDGEELMFASGEILNVELVDESGVWVRHGQSEEGFCLEDGEYEVEKWGEEDPEWEDFDDDSEIEWKAIGCSETSADALSEIGINSPHDLADKTADDLAKAKGFGPRKAENLLKAYAKEVGDS